MLYEVITYLLVKDKELLTYAGHAYHYLMDHCLDREEGGVFWSTRYDGSAEDTTKHTYNLAFSIYALSSYYDASKEEEALKTAFEIYRIIETRCTDSVGYLESFHRDFTPESNDKLSRKLNEHLDLIQG